MYNSNAAICLTLFMALFGIGSCTQCYHCISKENQNCLKANALSMDCASKESMNFKKDNLYNILPTSVFGDTDAASRYCHKIKLENNTIILTCLHGNLNNLNETCNTMIEDSKTSTSDKKVATCFACIQDNCNKVDVPAKLPISPGCQGKNCSTSHNTTHNNTTKECKEKDCKDGAEAISMSLRLSALTLVITYYI